MADSIVVSSPRIIKSMTVLNGRNYSGGPYLVNFTSVSPGTVVSLEPYRCTEHDFLAGCIYTILNIVREPLPARAKRTPPSIWLKILL